MRILLIDDDERSADAVRSALVGYRVEVECVRDGGSGYDRAQAEPPSAIVLAVELAPQKQGYNLCRRLKKSAELKQTPVVLLSVGDPYLEDHKKLSTRADAYLLKPIAARAFVETLESLVGPLPGAPAVESEEIIDLEEPHEVAPPRDVTAVVEMVEDISDEDILDVNEQVPVEVPPRARPSPGSSAFAPASEDDNFDAMLESLEFKDDLRVTSAKLDAVDAELNALRSERRGPPEAPRAPSLSLVPESAVPTRPPKAEADERDREILDLKERLSRAEHVARERGERLTAVEAELAEVRKRAQRLEAATSTKSRELVEEIAARDQEIAERRAHLEHLAAEHATGIERVQREHSEALGRVRSELEAERARQLEAAQHERQALEAALQQRIRAAEALHDRSLGEARQEAKRYRDEADVYRHELEGLRAQIAELEGERRDLDVAVSERIAAAADEARRPLEEELGRRAEQHARDMQELRRELADLQAAEARAAGAAAELGRAAAEVRARDIELAELRKRLPALEAELVAAMQRGEALQAEIGRFQVQLRETEAQRSTLEARSAEWGQALQVRADLEARVQAAEERLARAMARLKVEEKRKEKLKKAAEILVKLLEDRGES